MEVSFIKLLNKSKFLYILRLYHFINREIFLQKYLNIEIRSNKIYHVENISSRYSE